MNNEYVFAHLTITVLVAAISGMLLARLKQPVMIGYILAGIVFGPSGYGYISSQDQVQFYSELGIVLLLFVIGLELNIKSFLKMWKIPTLFTVTQVVTNVLIALCFVSFFDFPLYISLLGAFIVSLSSTAAIVKILEHMGEIRTDVGHISIGILVAQDISIVPMMIIIKQCSSSFSISAVVNIIIAILMIFLLIRHIVRKDKIKLPLKSIVTNAEITPIATLALCLTSASLVVFLGLSEAYGAFLAGLFVGNTEERQHVLNHIKPIQNVLLMAFFLSVGLMFDLNFLCKNWPVILASLSAVTIWKIASNTFMLKLFSIELSKAVTIGIILAQLGEFSLLLSNVAIDSQIIDMYGQKLIVCVTALSLTISPFFISLATRTKNLSFVGDNSISSIFKVLFSPKFSKEVHKLSIESLKIKGT